MPRVKKHAAVHPVGTSTFLSLLTGWMQQGIQSFAATQRIFGEVALRQGASVTKSLREGVADREHSPVTILTELAIEGTSSFMEAQRILLSLAQQENDIVMNGVQERLTGSVPGAAMTDLVRRSLDTFLRLQQDFLRVTSKQTLQWLQAVKSGKNYEGDRLVDLAREEMETFVRAQTKFLDMIAQQTSHATAPRRAKAVKRTELWRLAKEATNSFVEAQKQLLEVVSQQMHVNLEATTRMMKLVSPSRLLPVAGLTGEGMKNLVGAEKALIESMIKPRRAGAAARRQGAAQHRKAESAHVAHAGA